MRHDRSVNGRNAARMCFLQTSGQTFNEAAFKKPDENRNCAAMASDGYGGPYLLPFTVYRKGQEWFNTKHDTKIEVNIVKWRYV